MSMNYPMATPPPVTVGNQDSTQNILINAMLANMKPDQAASVQAALARQAAIAGNRFYMENTIRKFNPALTNGIATQNYALNSPLTFNLTTSLDSMCEGIILRWTVNYTLATGTSAVYGLTPGGVLSTIDSVDVNLNKNQHHVRPQVLRQLALMGALEEYVIPESVFGSGNQITSIQSYLNTGMPVTTGANTTTAQIFIPFSLLDPQDTTGLIPIVKDGTGIQVTVNTPLALFGGHPILNALYPVSGSGHAVSAVSGTVSVYAVYRDGDNTMSSARLPFDMSAVNGTFQMQIAKQLLPWSAGAYQRTNLNIIGKHAYVILLCVDGIQSNLYSTLSNIAYIEHSKDSTGNNVFERYGAQTNMSINDYFFKNRMNFKQDLDQGVIPFIHGPVTRLGDPHLRTGKQYLDNSRNGWPDWCYCVVPTAVGSGTINGQPCNPVIEPHVFYINPVGLVPVSSIG